VILLFFCYKKHLLSFEAPSLSILLSGIIALLIAVFILFDFKRVLSELPIHYDKEIWDSIYFTTIITSLRHGPLATAWYELGTPLNYQTGGYFAPSGFAACSGISSHVVLWGIWMPFYKTLTYVMVADVAFTFLNIKEKNFWLRPSIVLMFLLLTPLHPLYLLKLDFKNIIFLGDGYLLPGGNPSFTSSFPWMFAAFILFIANIRNELNLFSRCIFILITAFLVLLKIPMAFAFFVFIGFTTLLLTIKSRNWRLFFEVLIAGLLALIFYKINYADNGLSRISLKFGYLFDTYAKLAGFKSLYIGILVVGLLYIIWGSIRFLGIYFLWRKNDESTQIYKFTSISVIVTLLTCTLIPSFLTNKLYDINNKYILDATFDFEQFIRATFLLITITAIFGFVQLLGDQALKYKKVIIFTLIIWCTLSFSSLVVRSLNQHAQVENCDWVTEVVSELKEAKPALSAMVPSNTYSGQMLVANDLGPFWVSVAIKEGGYNMNNKNSWRWQIIYNCVSDSIAQQKNAYAVLKKEGVSLIIMNPDTKDKLKTFQKNNGITESKFKWLLVL
jgi:hypothetical protein